MAPSGGDTLLALEIPSELGQREGRMHGRLGPAVIDDEGGLRFMGVLRAPEDGADPGARTCEPSAVADVEFRSVEGGLDVRSICGLQPWDFHIPEAAVGFRMSAMFLEAERTAAGAEGAVLVLVSLEDADGWSPARRGTGPATAT